MFGDCQNWCWRFLFTVCSLRELIRCLKWYMDRSAELVRQDHIQEAMRVDVQCKHWCLFLWDHRRAGEAVNGIKGSVALASYNCLTRFFFIYTYSHNSIFRGRFTLVQKKLKELCPLKAFCNPVENLSRTYIHGQCINTPLMSATPYPPSSSSSECIRHRCCGSKFCSSFLAVTQLHCAMGWSSGIF